MTRQWHYEYNQSSPREDLEDDETVAREVIGSDTGLEAQLASASTYGAQKISREPDLADVAALELLSPQPDDTLPRDELNEPYLKPQFNPPAVEWPWLQGKPRKNRQTLYDLFSIDPELAAMPSAPIGEGARRYGMWDAQYTSGDWGGNGAYAVAEAVETWQDPSATDTPGKALTLADVPRPNLRHPYSSKRAWQRPATHETSPSGNAARHLLGAAGIMAASSQMGNGPQQ